MERTAAEIGQAFKNRRLGLGLKQEELQGVSSATVRNIENGQQVSPRPRTLIALAKALAWPSDAYERLQRGDDVASLHTTAHAGAPAVRVAASGSCEPSAGADVDDLTDDEARTIHDVLDRLEATLQRHERRLDRLEESRAARRDAPRTR